MKKIKKVSKTIFEILFIILIFLDSILFLGLKWIIKNIGIVSIDEVIFHINVPLKGTSQNLIIDAITKCLIPSLIITIILGILLLYKFKNNVIISIKIFKLNISFYIKKLFWIVLIILSVIFLFVQLNSFNKKFKIIDYFKAQSQYSSFIEENYVDPRTVNITFKSKKRNLIYIFLESMETTYSDKKNGGLQNKDLIPELTELAKNNINFSNTNKVGGASSMTGTGWTIAGMVAQTAGVPLKMPVNSSVIYYYNQFLAGAYSLSDVLNKFDYNQMAVFGSDSDFGGRKTYYKTHGNVVVKDLFDARNEGFVPGDYYVFWGLEDDKLFDYSKNYIVDLSKQNKPFSFTILSVNTHFPNGFVDESCKINTGNNYADSISCSSKEVYNFVEWIKKQDFYKDTTIIITGDHLSMAKNDIFNGGNEENRKIYNSIINSPIKPTNTMNREFTSFDLYPTTLASIGATVEGDKLALGTNLYSNKQTLVEQFGINKVKNELKKKSNFYNDNVLYKK